jgi:hypothetical protein
MYPSSLATRASSVSFPHFFGGGDHGGPPKPFFFGLVRVRTSNLSSRPFPISPKFQPELNSEGKNKGKKKGRGQKKRKEERLEKYLFRKRNGKKKTKRGKERERAKGREKASLGPPSLSFPFFTFSAFFERGSRGTRRLSSAAPSKGCCSRSKARGSSGTPVALPENRGRQGLLPSRNCPSVRQVWVRGSVVRAHLSPLFRGAFSPSDLARGATKAVKKAVENGIK